MLSNGVKLRSLQVNNFTMLSSDGHRYPIVKLGYGCVVAGLEHWCANVGLPIRRISNTETVVAGNGCRTVVVPS